MSSNARWLTVAVLIIVVLGAAYAIYKRNTTAVNDYNTSNTTAPMADTATATTMPSATMPGVAPGSPFEVSNTADNSGTTGGVAGSPEAPNSMAPATTQ
jgi:hypothetical protein